MLKYRVGGEDFPLNYIYTHTHTRVDQMGFFSPTLPVMMDVERKKKQQKSRLDLWAKRKKKKKVCPSRSSGQMDSPAYVRFNIRVFYTILV